MNASRYKGEGMNAYEDGMSFDDCPYDEDSQKREEWITGWTHMRTLKIEAEKDSPYEVVKQKLWRLQGNPRLVDVLSDIIKLIENKV